MEVKDFRTQKAKGIHKSYMIPPYRAGLAHLDQSIKVLPHYMFDIEPPEFPLFARPCPTRPRHGFVESRPVTDHKGVLKALTDTLRADPLGELVLAKPLSGRWSGVATNAGVTWGTGNDGVTGYGHTVTIPAPGRVSHWNKFLFRGILPDEPSDYGITDTAYAELVEDRGISRLVQLRDGPAQQTEVNFIPERMEVNTVLRPYEAKNDLLRWERWINAATPGTAVELYGSSLSSHFAVHAIQKGIPVVTDRRIHPDDVLEPITTEHAELTAADHKAIADQMHAWIDNRDYIIPSHKTYADMHNVTQALWMPHVEGVIATAIGTIQTQHLWGNAAHLMTLRAMAIPTLVRFLVSAVSGELRHMRSGFDFPKGFDPEYYSKSRNNYYMPILQGRVSLDDMKAFLPSASEAFYASREDDDYDDDEYDYAWEDGYGGSGWASIANMALELIEKLQAFRDEPTKGHWETVVNGANAAVNTMHNNGYAAEKWLQDDTLAAINTAPAVAFFNDFAARIALGLPLALDMEGLD